MKTLMRVFTLAVLSSVLLLSATVPGASQTAQSNDQFANKLVHQLLGVRPGNVVVITADPTHVALAEAIATSVYATGAFPIISYGSNGLNRMYFERVPARFDSLSPKGALRLLQIADETVAIDFPFDPSVVAGVPASRLAALTAAGNAATEYVIRRGLPGIDIGNGILPSAATAQTYGVSTSVLSALFWSGLNADYTQIQGDAATVASALGGNSARLTAPNGTDLTFALSAQPAEINDGIISAADRARGGAAVQKQLPAGDVDFIPKSGTANGTLVFGATRVNGTLISGLTVHFAGGKITSMRAAGGMTTFSDLYKAGNAGRDELGIVDVGTNRSMHVPAGGTWGPGPSMAAGYVTLTLGNNLAVGGSNRSSFVFPSNVPDATVTVNGKRLVSDGTLQTGT
jgi:leucyl aminopeptidase (aminopeptidase T)